MKQKPITRDILWIVSEICYYLGLVCALLFLPSLTFVLWVMSLIDMVSPDYWYLLVAWGMSLVVFLAGVGLKNYIYSTGSS